MKNLSPHSVTLPFAHPELIGQPLLSFGAFNMEEIWKPIPTYNGYEASSLGNIRSIDRIFYHLTSGVTNLKGVILKQHIERHGYYRVTIYKNKKREVQRVHKLIAMAFFNFVPCGYDLVVNHKNFIRTDNKLENLEVVTQRENANKKHLKHSSTYTGVTWNKECKKWQAQINHKYKHKHIGLFINEIDAHNAYCKEL